MGCALAGAPPPPLLLLLLLLLEAPGGHGLSCSVSPVNWTAGLTATCLNFSGQGLEVLPAELAASDLEHLDLSWNRLQYLPAPFFASLEKLQVLDVTGNPLSMVAGELGARCALELQADCACALAPWHQARANCSAASSLQCHSGFNHTRNLTRFLETHCPEGLGPAAIGGLVGGACVLLTLGLVGSYLAYRFRGLWATGTQSPPGKTLGAPQKSRPNSSRQSRYSSRARNVREPGAVQPSPASADYENMFQGEPTQPRWNDRTGSAQDSDYYMEFDQSADASPQAIYCNLQALQEQDQDEEDYVIPGH